MRCSNTFVYLIVAILVVGLTGCHSTGVWDSKGWTTSSFNPVTWRMGIKPTPSSLAAAPPAKPSLTATPIYPNTSDARSLASSTTPPKVEYPTTSASFNAPGFAAQNPLMASKSPLSTTKSPLMASKSPLSTTKSPLATKSPLMAPQKGRYGGANSLASGSIVGYKNPIYNTPASSTPLQKTPLVQNPYQGSVPTIPQSNGSLATAAAGLPYSPKTTPSYNASTDSRYQAAVASSNSRPTYSNDPNSRYYGSPAANPPTAPGSATLPKVVNGYPSTSVGSPAVTTAKAPPSRYLAVPSPVNVTTPANSNLPAANYPAPSPAVTTPPSASYQPGANSYQPGNNGYQPGANGYQPGNNGYQIPATRSTAPIQSGSQPVGYDFGYNSPAGKSPAMEPLAPTAKGEAPPFRPGSTGSVEDYPRASGSAESSTPVGTYPNTQNTSPVKTSINTSNVMPVGFNQDTLPLRR